MNNEQKRAVIEALVKFVTRVSKGEATCETEIAVLPQVARVLVEITTRL